MTFISNEKSVFDKDLTIEQATIIQNNSSFERYRIKREESAAALIVNTETKCVILTQQFRYPIHDQTDEWLTEIPAGRVESNQTPLETMRREILEETGYAVQAEKFQLISVVFVTPGYSSEKLSLYYAEVKNTEKIQSGGGLAEEHEFIKIREIPLSIFFNQIEKSEVKDLKTLTAGQWLLLHSKHL